MKDEDLEQLKKEWQQQTSLQQSIDLFLRQGLPTMLSERRRTQYQRRRRSKWRTLWVSLLLLLLSSAASVLSFGHNLTACGIIAAALGLLCLWVAVAAGHYLHLLMHAHPVTCSYAEVQRNDARISRLEALRRLRRRRAAALLHWHVPPLQHTLRWAGAAGVACLLFIVVLCLWQVPQPSSPTLHMAQQAQKSAPPAALATNPVAQAVPGTTFQQTYHHTTKTQPQSAIAAAPQCVTAKDKGIHGAYNKMVCNEDCDIATVLNVLNVLCLSSSEEIVS